MHYSNCLRLVQFSTVLISLNRFFYRVKATGGDWDRMGNGCNLYFVSETMCKQRNGGCDRSPVSGYSGRSFCSGMCGNLSFFAQETPTYKAGIKSLMLK